MSAQVKMTIREGPVHSAARNGDLNQLVKLLRETSSGDSDKPHPLVEQRNNLGETPLLVAASQGHPEIVQQLVNTFGANPLAQDKFYEHTVLTHFISKNQSPAVIASFLECIDQGVDSFSSCHYINTGEKYGQTPLHLATRRGDLEIVQMLLHHPAINVNAQDKFGIAPLHRAKTVEIVSALLQTNLCNVNIPDHEALTPLHYAARYRDLKALQWLLRYNANVHARDVEGRTAIHLAREYDLLAELLHVPDCPINVRDHTNGETPLHYAVAKNELEVVQLLLCHPDIDVNTRDHKGRTPLHFGKEKEVVASLLHSERCAVNLGDSKGETALHLAARRGDLAVVRLLVQACANVHIKTPIRVVKSKKKEGGGGGETALHLAAKQRHADLVHYLLPRVLFNS